MQGVCRTRREDVLNMEKAFMVFLHHQFEAPSLGQRGQFRPHESISHTLDISMLPLSCSVSSATDRGTQEVLELQIPPHLGAAQKNQIIKYKKRINQETEENNSLCVFSEFVILIVAIESSVKLIS